MDATQIIVLLLGIIVGGMNITVFISVFKLYFKYIDNIKDIESRLTELNICKQDRIYFDSNNNSYTIQELAKMQKTTCEEVYRVDKSITNCVSLEGK